MSEKKTSVPKCGLYRTTRETVGIPAGRLVYFHNHGTPGPGLYLPASWTLNKATFNENGHTLPEPWQATAHTLAPMPAEGFYQVAEAFYCCEKKCRKFPKGLFVQLGYNGAATPLVFVPELTSTGIAVPEIGTPVEEETLSALTPVMVQMVAAHPTRREHSNLH